MLNTELEYSPHNYMFPNHLQIIGSDTFQRSKNAKKKSEKLSKEGKKNLLLISIDRLSASLSVFFPFCFLLVQKHEN